MSQSPPVGDTDLTLPQMIKAIYDNGHFNGRWAAKSDHSNTGKFDVWEAAINAYILSEVNDILGGTNQPEGVDPICFMATVAALRQALTAKFGRSTES